MMKFDLSYREKEREREREKKKKLTMHCTFLPAPRIDAHRLVRMEIVLWVGINRVSIPITRSCAVAVV